jgi:hypothetical protein
VGDLAVDTEDRLWATSAAVGFGAWPSEFGGDHVFRYVSGTTWESKSSGLVPGNPVNTILVDRERPGRLFIGADIGVFRSDDSGETWVAYDEGLPNAPVVHLEIQGSRRLLRAGTYGRSVWERPIDALGCAPITVFLRDTWLDTGRVTTPAVGIADPMDPQALLGWWDSPDIRVDAPVQGGFALTPVRDALDFDRLAHTPDFVRGEPLVEGFGRARVYVQAHNRGAAIGRGARVRVFCTVADATVTPPLPGNFWNDPFDAGNVSGVWRAIGPAQTVDLHPAVPRVLRWDLTITHPHEAAVHFLALVTHEDDPLDEADTLDVALLVRRRRHAAFKSMLIHAYQVPDRYRGEIVNPRRVHITKPDIDAHEYLVWRWGRIPQRGRAFIALESSDGRPVIEGSDAELAKLGIRRATGTAARAIPGARVYELVRGARNETRIPIHARARRQITLSYNLDLPKAKPGERFDFWLYRERDRIVPGGARVEVQVVENSRGRKGRR